MGWVSATWRKPKAMPEVSCEAHLHMQNVARSGGRGWAKANYAGGGHAAGREESGGEFSGSAASLRRLWESGGSRGEAAQEERGWGRFGARGWLHTKEQAVGRRYEADSQSPRQPSDKRVHTAGNGSRSPGLCNGQKGSESTRPSGTDGRTRCRTDPPRQGETLPLGIAVRSPGVR